MKLTKTLLFILSIIGILNTSVMADGKLLRGEKWQRFSVEKTEADFYVAPNGNDSWSGTLAAPNVTKTDGPFATIERAQQAVRQLKQKVYLPKKEPIEKRWIGSPHKLGKGKDILVLIGDGYYSLEKPLKFGPNDGGERIETNLPSGAFEYHKLKDHYVTYAAFPGEKPVISGGKKIDGWKKQKNRWTASVVKGLDVKKLIVNGETQILARTPNSGFFTPPKISKSTNELTFRPGELEQWPDMQNNRVIMLLRWHKGVNSILKIDTKSGVAFLKKPQRGIVVVPPRYYVENVQALLDAPGEWFFDKKSKELALIPQENISNPNNEIIVAPNLSELFIVMGKAERPVRNLRFYGLTFEATNPDGQAISLEYAHNCELVDSEVRSIGGTAIYLAKGCYQNRIMENRITSADNGAIRIVGDAHPVKWMDIIRENIVSQNFMNNCGGINIQATNALFTTISRNEISNTRGRTAISVGGWRNLEEAIDGGYRVEYNHLHHVQQYADDSGAITTSGLTHNSIVRRNLIHDVKAGYFNDNVAFWFDNMSSSWLTEENIYYNLEQGEMKLCAANLVDNIYRKNFVIESPENEPEGIIDGEPSFDFSNLKIESLDKNDSTSIRVGDHVKISARVFNSGSTGIQTVDLNVDGRVVNSKLFPVIRNNSRVVDFIFRFPDPGEHRVAIGTTPYKTISVTGKEIDVLFDDLRLSQSIIPLGEKVTISAVVKNLKETEQAINAQLYLNENSFIANSISMRANDTDTVTFVITPKVGNYSVRIGNSRTKDLVVYPHHSVDISKSDLKTYISGTAKPCDFYVDQQRNRYSIKASGTDFYHAEDSYGAIYLEKIKGNFIATVKVTRFGHRTHEWFRAGIFVRNDITKSFDIGPGSLGSVLMFTTPGRAGIQWDEFADGCMHKASSENLPENIQFPVWLKLERHGDSFSGYVSLDGENWSIERHTKPVPGLAETIDVGLAAGSDNQIPYLVEFEEFQLEVEDGE